MDNNEKFLYAVHPKKVIVGVGNVNCIRVPKSLELTKEEVLTCLKRATVYRRFAAGGRNERVTTMNLDRLHRADYISENDWEAFLTKEASDGHAEVESTPVDAPILEEKQEEEIKPVENNEPVASVDESNNQEAIEPEIATEDVVEVEEDIKEDSIDDNSEAVSIESNESDDTDNQIASSDKKNFQYYSNKKKK